MIWDFSTLFLNTTQKYKIGDKDKKKTIKTHIAVT